jgi:hypothetical protein
MSVTSAAWQELTAATSWLGDDEIRVLARIAERLRHGAGVYGQMHVASDRREFRKEAREEVEDALVYLACAWLKQEGGPR